MWTIQQYSAFQDHLVGSQYTKHQSQAAQQVVKDQKQEIYKINQIKEKREREREQIIDLQ